MPEAIEDRREWIRDLAADYCSRLGPKPPRVEFMEHARIPDIAVWLEGTLPNRKVEMTSIVVSPCQLEERGPDELRYLLAVALFNEKRRRLRRNVGIALEIGATFAPAVLVPILLLLLGVTPWIAVPLIPLLLYLPVVVIPLLAPLVRAKWRWRTREVLEFGIPVEGAIQAARRALTRTSIVPDRPLSSKERRSIAKWAEQQIQWLESLHLQTTEISPTQAPPLRE